MNPVIAFLLCALLWQLGKRRLKPGVLFAAFMGLNAVERILIDFLRAKDDRFLLGLSTSQRQGLRLLARLRAHNRGELKM